MGPWQVSSLAAVLLIVVGGVYAGRRPKAEVRVVSPQYEDLATNVESTGMVAPVHDFPARANFTGLVEAIYVHVGEKVRAGQMLMRMKDQYATPRLDKAKAELDDAIVSEQNVLHNGSQEDRIGSKLDLVKATTERDQAAAALQAMKQIENKGSVTEAEVEAATERLRVAQADLDALNGKLTSRYSAEDVKSWMDKVAADKASLEAEKVSWANANISTPIAGTVYALPTHLYDYAPAGTDLIHVADLSHLEIRANFEEVDLGKLAPGQPATITWEGAPGRAWHGHVQSKPLAVTQNGPRSVGECVILLDEDRGNLPLDTSVAIAVTIARHPHALTIPREALRSENGARFVYRVVDGELKRTSVETGLVNPMSAEIVHGLRPDDVVVMHATDEQSLADGVRASTSR